MEQLEKHYFKNARKGIILSVQDLTKYCREIGIKVPPQSQLRDLRYFFKSVAVHARFRNPPHYASATVPKLGSIFIDLMEFKKNLKVANKQRQYLLVAVDALSQRIECFSMPKKTQEWWEKGVMHFLKVFPLVRCFVSDRDVSISGKEFKARLFRTKNVVWRHLPSRFKAANSERSIRYLKDRVAVALSLNDRGNNRWLSHVDSVTQDYNKRFVKDTKIRRIDVNKQNEKKLLAQKYKTKEYEHIFNTSIAGNFSPELRKSVGFRFKEGDMVLVSRTANYRLKNDSFLKPSVEGSWGKTVYKIKRAFLKSNGRYSYRLCYKLTSPTLNGSFYQSELLPALFADRPDYADVGDEDATERRKKYLKAKKKREGR